MLGVPDAAAARIAAPEVKDELRRNTDEAIARGVFGVPTLAIGDELFWGADATAMAVDYVAAGSTLRRSGICARRRHFRRASARPGAPRHSEDARRDGLTTRPPRRARQSSIRRVARLAQHLARVFALRGASRVRERMTPTA